MTQRPLRPYESYRHLSHFLHGTRFLDDEPQIDREIIAIPPAYTIPLADRALTLQVIGYNLMMIGSRPVALGRLATRTMNAFLTLDPERSTELTTTDISEYWNQYGINTSGQAIPALRGIGTLDAIRNQFDNRPFIRAKRGSAMSSRQQLFSISPDITFADRRND